VSRSPGLISGMNWRIIGFWVYLYTTAALILLGIAAIWRDFGLAAMFGAVALLYLFYFWQERRRPISFSDDMGDDAPRLPPPGTRRLPRPGPPQIGRSQAPRPLPGPRK
jgi:hypothetical protein